MSAINPRTAVIAWAKSRPALVAGCVEYGISTVHDPSLGYPQIVVSTEDDPVVSQQGSLAMQQTTVEFACIGGPNVSGSENPDFAAAWTTANLLVDELNATTRDGYVVLADGTWVSSATPLAPTTEGVDDTKSGVVIVTADFTLIPTTNA